MVTKSSDFNGIVFFDGWYQIPSFNGRVLLMWVQHLIEFNSLPTSLRAWFCLFICNQVVVIKRWFKVKMGYTQV